MLVCCNTRLFFGCSFFVSDFIIGKYLISSGFFKDREFTFTRIKDGVIVVESVH